MSKRLLNDLKHKIHFIYNNNSASIVKQPIDAEGFSVYAQITPITEHSYSLIENLNFGQILKGNYFLFTVRFDKRITNKLTILYFERKFDIKRIINFQEKNLVQKILTIEMDN